MSADERPVLTDVREGVLYVTINRAGKRNALNRATLAALREAFAEIAHDLSLHAVVLTGAGERPSIGRLAKLRVACAAPLAIVAIDPSSRKSSGALLGDRVRMDALLDGTDVLSVRSRAAGLRMA